MSTHNCTRECFTGAGCVRADFEHGAVCEHGYGRDFCPHGCTEFHRCRSCGEYVAGPRRESRDVAAAYERGVAAGRAEERAAIVAWLKNKATLYSTEHFDAYAQQRERGGSDACDASAAQIERGEHVRGPSKQGGHPNGGSER